MTATATYTAPTGRDTSAFGSHIIEVGGPVKFATAVPIAVAGMVTPLIAAAAMSGSSLARDVEMPLRARSTAMQAGSTENPIGLPVTAP